MFKSIYREIIFISLNALSSKGIFFQENDDIKTYSDRQKLRVSHQHTLTKGNSTGQKKSDSKWKTWDARKMTSKESGNDVDTSEGTLRGHLGGSVG